MSERVLLDACVLFPTALRRVLLGVAAADGFVPLWSPRILEEWARATRRLPEGAEAAARAEIAAMRARWPDAEVEPDAPLVAGLSLPDADDRHVLAAAIAGGAGALMTLNRRDFPTRVLARHGILLREPDGFLCERLDEGAPVLAIAEAVRAEVAPVAGLRGMLKRAGLPRLGKRAGADGR